MRESVFYQSILKEGEEKGLREGEAMGESKGKILEAKSLILRLGNKRFGTPNPAMVARIEAEDALSALEALSLRLLEVKNWDELLAPTD